MYHNLTDVLIQTAEKYPNEPSFLTRNQDGKFGGPTWKELYEMVLDLATGLSLQGLVPRENVALLADNRLEWILADYAVLFNGAADVPRGTDVTDDEIVYIVNHSDAPMVMLENEKMLGRWEKLKAQCPKVKHVIVLEKSFTDKNGAIGLYSLLEKGKSARAAGDKSVAERRAKIQPDDLFTMIYTSGTTGAPKGVMLMHSNMVSQVNNLPGLLEVTHKDRALSILPVWHVFERVLEYIFVALGASTFYTSRTTLLKDFATVQPTFMGSAPRLWEFIYESIQNKMEKAGGAKLKLFRAAIFCSRHVRGFARFVRGNELKLTKPNPLVSLFQFFKKGFVAALLLLPYLLLDLIVLKKIRAATGGKMRGTISGGGALPLHIDMFYNAIGIPVLEGYGMTETSPVISVRTLNHLVPGTVGDLAPLTKLELRDDAGNIVPQGKPGVIFVKGPQVMKGYYKNEEATKKVLYEGWMNTGDIGVMTFNDCLKITGRAKDTVVLISGENVEPVPIENKMAESQYIEHVMVVGQDKHHLAALVYIHQEKIAEYAKENNLSGEYSQLINLDAIKKLIEKEIKTRVNALNGFKNFEVIKDFRIIPKAFEVGDELTNLFKVKRHKVTEKYKELIDEIYK